MSGAPPLPPINIKGGNAGPSRAASESGEVSSPWNAPITVYPSGTEPVYGVVRGGAVVGVFLILVFAGFVLWLKNR